MGWRIGCTECGPWEEECEEEVDYDECLDKFYDDVNDIQINLLTECVEVDIDKDEDNQRQNLEYLYMGDTDRLYARLSCGDGNNKYYMGL